MAKTRNKPYAKHRIVLGPAKCEDCGDPVWFAPAKNGRGAATWRNRDRTDHDCYALEATA